MLRTARGGQKNEVPTLKRLATETIIDHLDGMDFVFPSYLLVHVIISVQPCGMWEMYLRIY